MKLQVTTIATAKQLATMTARFQILAAPEMPAEKLNNLSKELNANLNARLDALAEHHRLRLRDRPILSQAAKEAYQAEMQRIRQWMVVAPKTLN